MILAFDPSSTATGWAAMSSGGYLAAWGVIKPPSKVKGPVERMRWMAVQAERVLWDWEPQGGSDEWLGVVETPSTHIARKAGSHPSGLATYGLAAGYILCLVDSCMPARSVTTVAADEWTKTRTVPGSRRRASKEVRAQMVAAIFPKEYKLAEDPGLDGADAIGLAMWLRESQGVG